jgi:4-amino-4-deoxy-L-arabinose transferase
MGCQPGKKSKSSEHRRKSYKIMPTPSEHEPMETKKISTILFLFFLFVYIFPLGTRDLLVPDETRYGEIPREMIAGRDWVVPHFNRLRYFEKPVLGYWVHAGSLLLFGDNNFAVRLPSALAVGLSALMVFMLVCRIRRKNTTEECFSALLAALIYLSCFEVVGVGNIAVLDSLFSFFLTGTIASFYFASEAPRGEKREKCFLLLAGVSCGAAFLTKGFLAFAVPVIALAPYLIWQRRYSDLFRMSWLPICAAVLAALPWGIMIHLKEPDFWHFFFWNEHIRRFMAESAQHRASFWFFFAAAPGLFMPWTFLIPAAIPAIKERLFGHDSRGNLLRLCLCWLVFPFLFFSLSKGKLLTYILPCFPPFAILMALGLSHSLENGKRKLFQWGVAGVGFFVVILFFALIYGQFFGFRGFRLYTQPWKAVMLANGLLFMAVFCFWSLRSRMPDTKIMLLGLSPFLLFFLGHFLIPDIVIEESALGRLLEKHRSHIQPETVIISCEDAAGAANWSLKRDDVYVLGWAGEMAYGLTYQDAAGRQLNEQSVRNVMDENRGKTVLICPTKGMDYWRNILPVPVFREDTGPRGFEIRGY